MSNIVKFTYRNAKGQRAILGNFPPYRILNYSGLGTPDNEISSDSMYGRDGQVKKGSRLDVRNIDLDILIESANFSQRRQRINALMQVMNPKLAGTLIYEVEDERYEIAVEVTKGFEPVKGTYNKGTVQLRALSPYIKDLSQLSYKVSLSQRINNHIFPLEITSSYEFSKLENNNVVKIENNGQAPVGFELRINFSAEASMVRLENVYTLEYFQANHNFKTGDTLYLNTKDGELEFLINGYNGMPERDLNSTFMQLNNDKDNYFKLSAKSGQNAMIATLSYEPVVLGVF